MAKAGIAVKRQMEPKTVDWKKLALIDSNLHRYRATLRKGCPVISVNEALIISSSSIPILLASRGSIELVVLLTVSPDDSSVISNAVSVEVVTAEVFRSCSRHSVSASGVVVVPTHRVQSAGGASEGQSVVMVK